MLGDLAQYINGRAFTPDEWGAVGLPIVRIEQINDPNADCDHYDGTIEDCHRIDDGDLLFSWSATLTAIIWNRGPAVLNQHIFKVIPNNDVDLHYLHHLLDFLLPDLAAHTHGSTMKHIKRTDLLPYITVVAPLSEQRRIAEILDTADEAIQKTEALIAKLKAMKAGLLNDLFTRGLDEHDRLRDPEAHPEQFKNSPLGRIPTGWDTPTFAEITQDDAPVCYGIVQPGPYRDSGVPVIAIQDLNGDYRNVHRSAKSIEVRYTRSRIIGSDVLLSIKGTTGRVDMVPDWFKGNISRDIARIRTNYSASPNYVRQMLSSPFYQRHLEHAVVGTTRSEVSIGILRKLRLPLPELDEQRRMAEVLKAHDGRIRAEEKYLEKLKLQKKGLMHDLLTGRVRVNVSEEGDL